MDEYKTLALGLACTAFASIWTILTLAALERL